MFRTAFNKSLIEVVKRSLLWDVKMEDFRKNHKKSILWEEIAEVAYFHKVNVAA